MYQVKTTGFLELLMNVLSLPRSQRSSGARRTRPVPRRRETALQRSVRDSLATKEIYFEAARLSRWNR